MPCQALICLPAVVMLGPVGMALTAGSRLVSRHRELYADRCAAALTGSPSSVEVALMKISGERGSLRLPDLRVAAARDELHIVPERRQPTGSRRIWATHPPVDDRVAALREMERELQSARFSADMSADLQVPHRGLTREGSYALAGKRTVAG